MPSFQRSQVRSLCRLLESNPEHMIAIFGPRQAGKTTIVQQARAQTRLPGRYLAVDEPDYPAPGLEYDAREMDIGKPQERNTDWLVRLWQAARLEAERSGQGFVLVLGRDPEAPRLVECCQGPLGCRPDA